MLSSKAGRRAEDGWNADSAASWAGGLPGESHRQLCQVDRQPVEGAFDHSGLIGSLFFLLIALTAEGLACSVCNKHLPPPDNKKKEAAFITESERCTVVGFVEGTHDIEEPWQDNPTGCFAKIADRLRQQTPGILLIIGHSDLRGLKSRPRRIYASNLTLGYQRAMIVSKRLLHEARSGGTTDSNIPDLDKRVVLLSVGAGNVRSGQKVDLMLLAEDRVVDVVPLWNVMTEAGEIRH
jgi:hypothetical protein